MPSAQDKVRRILPASCVHPCPLGSHRYPFPLNYMLSHLLLLLLKRHPKAGEWLERNTLLSSADGRAQASRRQVVGSAEPMLSALLPEAACWEDQASQAVWETAALTTGKIVLQYDLKTNSFPFRVRKHSRPLAGLHGFCWGWCSRKRGREKLIPQDFRVQTGRRHQCQLLPPAWRHCLQTTVRRRHMPQIRMTVSELGVTVRHSIHLRWEDTHGSVKRRMLFVLQSSDFSAVPNSAKGGRSSPSGKRAWPSTAYSRTRATFLVALPGGSTVRSGVWSHTATTRESLPTFHSLCSCREASYLQRQKPPWSWLWKKRVHLMGS